MNAAHNGIEGVLKEELLDLALEPDEEVALLSVTPAAVRDWYLPLQAQGSFSRRL